MKRRRAGCPAWIALAALAATPVPAQALEQLRLEPGENVVSCAMLDTRNGYGYFGTAEQPFRYASAVSSATLLRLRLSDFSITGRLAMPAGENPLTAGVIAPDRPQAFIGTYGDPNLAIPASVIEVDLAGWRRVRSLTLGRDEAGIRAAVVDPLHGVLYFGTLFGTVVGVDMDRLQLVGSLGLQQEDNGFQCAAVDPKGQFAYFGTAAGNIMKIRLSDLTPQANLTTLRGEKGFSAAAMPPSGSPIYLATEGAPARLLRLDAAQFRIDKQLILEEGENHAVGVFLDPERPVAYVVTAEAPIRIVAVDLLKFERLGAAALPTSIGRARCAAFDPSRRTVYLGAGRDRGLIVKTEVPTKF